MVDSCKGCKYRHNSWLGSQFDECHHPVIKDYWFQKESISRRGFCDIETDPRYDSNKTCGSSRELYEHGTWQELLKNFFW